MVKGILLRRTARIPSTIFFGLILVVNLTAGARAQSAPAADSKEPGSDSVQRRITRARSLAAVGKLAAAAAELESLRASSADESARDVSRILLMWIYVEMPDYARAVALLDETYKARTAANESSVRAYYALAGQTVNGVRTHAERYRTFGLRVDDEQLPAEARTDLDQLRSLLERVFEQAKKIREDEAKTGTGDRGADATALVEEAANVRLRLARDDDERERWQREIADARQRLFAPETRMAKVSVPPAPVTSTANANTSPPAASNNPVAASASVPGASAQPVATTNAPSGADAAEARKAEEASRDAGQTGAAGGAAETTNAGGTPVSVGALHGKATQKIAPSYPSIARTARITGLVTVFVIVNEKGEVERVQRADGPTQLQSAAAEAARRWRFRPTLVDGQPVRVAGYINFNFTL